MEKTIIFVGLFDIDEIIKYCQGFGPSHTFLSSPKSSIRKGKENKYEMSGFRKVNPYTKIEYTIKLFWQMQNPVDIKQGEKIKTICRGKLRITMEIDKETDYVDKFENTKKGNLDKKVFENSIEDQLSEMDERMDEMICEWRDNVKNILNTII
ncbi:hypothetical protein HOK68_00070 [Candidatus Woesearchaeota archaeon]|jgi:hypothetical protein|nr:hypothetical protein [Candidatus Woesearchaeota archaeon]MBT4387524.1 hypothetical protein [Candidatus Woesearchaeota archaeon]MBT4595366.1 hypothetical protein [Candidatus Woesearchaeota archaeon]MBT5741229.1 hypothetical protein [Candidatus Woesearchaeota archaeon]MBT6505157.1 hypothetical protein [Candidatus Woesearchaeota archaeon]